MSYIENPQAAGPRLHNLEGLLGDEDLALAVWEAYEESFAAAPFEFGIMEILRVLKHMRGLGHQITLSQHKDIGALFNMVDRIMRGHGIEVKDAV